MIERLVRRRLDRPPKKRHGRFRMAVPAKNDRPQMQGLAMVGIKGKDLFAKLFGPGQITSLVMMDGPRQQRRRIRG